MRIPVEVLRLDTNYWKTKCSAWGERLSSMVPCTVLVILVSRDRWACAFYMKMQSALLAVL